MNDNPYADGLVVVPRKWARVRVGRGKRQRTRTGWTLHVRGCSRLGRVKSVMPAPAQEYADTVKCAYCRPGDPHQYAYATSSDGTVTATCGGCDIVVVRGTLKRAATQMRLEHDYAEAEALVTAAREAGELVNVVVPRIAADGERTLHRASCSYARRSRDARPAPAELDAATVACVYCKPDVPEAVDRAARLEWSGGHKRKRERGSGAQVRIICDCGADTGMRPNDNSARAKLGRLHAAAERERERERQRVRT